MLQFQWPPPDVAPLGVSKINKFEGATIPDLSGTLPCDLSHDPFGVTKSCYPPLPTNRQTPVKTLASRKHNEGTLTLK